ncbi:hypothetical protein [Ktedonospora formicarum]|uniref:Uncharacterized protein n=1 Tax=Ktedonospora formicarum TaxID=2778364 RepID=A0A8J3IHL7_9CHLR|nr:hypothetical protein [Ktedonospora formicarum]GHO51294.1 hypothetical protein KSX_94570 [Ktedonospora formicarum]
MQKKARHQIDERLMVVPAIEGIDLFKITQVTMALEKTYQDGDTSVQAVPAHVCRRVACAAPGHKELV